MYTTPEQLASANKANVESMLTLDNTAFASAERFAALNLNTARAVLEDSVNNAKAAGHPGPARRREGRCLLA